MTGLSVPEAHAAALAGLAGMNPRRLAKLLDGFRPVMAWRAVQAGTHPGDPGRRFAAAAGLTNVPAVGERYVALGVRVLLPGDLGYPPGLVGDPGAPAVLFALGDPMLVDGRPRVAIVGTRSATHYGRRVASELAGSLAAEGVSVVSGLAAGIDAAAHAGAIRATQPGTAPPVAVVGTGLDVVYPTSNRELWAQVAERGVVLSESGIGTPPHPGVFPARNRIIAALSDVVVIVESHCRGGALYTAEAAARRSIPVCAVPGSVHSRASQGSNALLVDGCTPVRDAEDVLVALSLARAGRDLAPDPTSGSDTPRAPSHPRPEALSPCARPGRSPERAVTTTGHRGAVARDRPVPSDTTAVMRATLTGPQRALLAAVDDTPTAFETILTRTDLTIVAAAEACDQLVERGILRSGAGWWSTR